VAVDELADVPREDQDEEHPGGESDRRSVPTGQEQRTAERDLDDAGDDDDEVGVEHDPSGDLCSELLSGAGEMGDAGCEEEGAQHKPADLTEAGVPQRDTRLRRWGGGMGVQGFSAAERALAMARIANP